MTIYEFFVECPEHDVRLEVPVRDLRHALELFGRLDAHADRGAGRIVERLPGHSAVEDLTLDDARHLLDGIDEVFVGRPGRPGQGPRRRTDEALAALPRDAVFEASYYEV